MPGIIATEAQFVAQYRVSKSESRLPEPDRPYWFHAVVSVGPATTQALDELAVSTSCNLIILTGTGTSS
ncbi:hypothetical protein [Actinomyces sp. 2119]|nr:hypothetical protein [Actinomyces sp. 2119]